MLIAGSLEGCLMRTRFGFAAAAISLLATPSAATEPRKLDGQYWIGSKTILDAPRGEKKDRVYFSLSGKAARDMYDAMPAKPVRRACDEGAWVKEAGDLQCVKSGPTNVMCSLAVTLDRGRTAPGSVC
jgi:hypothetical protein